MIEEWESSDEPDQLNDEEDGTQGNRHYNSENNNENSLHSISTQTSQQRNCSRCVHCIDRSIQRSLVGKIKIRIDQRSPNVFILFFRMRRTMTPPSTRSLL